MKTDNHASSPVTSNGMSEMGSAKEWSPPRLVDMVDIEQQTNGLNPAPTDEGAMYGS